MVEVLLVSVVLIVTALVMDHPGTEIVLLDNKSSSNAIIVTTEGGSLTIDTPYEGTRLESSSEAPSAPETVSDAELTAEDAETFAVAPPPPLTLTLYFENNSAGLTSKSRRDLAQILPLLRELSPLRITITGYTDTTGSESYNLALSEKRASALKTMLEQRDVTMRRCQTDGLGEYLLQVQTPDDTTEPQNRRVVMTIR
ncbi:MULTISPECIES: OmpA family protein [Sulfurimonas]|uniref:OmpA family protein n=1 Tax=Sulfurimonas diazotrophicus TaxID=3131939 RepID=A0ABZ3HDB2_9BACT